MNSVYFSFQQKKIGKVRKIFEKFFEKDIDSGGGKGLDCHSVLGSTEFFKSYSAGEEREGSRCFLSIREEQQRQD